MELPAATKPTNANFVRVIRKKCSMNQGCHKRFYSHMFFCIIYFFPFETSATASCGYTCIYILYLIYFYGIRALHIRRCGVLGCLRTGCPHPRHSWAQLLLLPLLPLVPVPRLCRTRPVQSSLSWPNTTRQTIVRAMWCSKNIRQSVAWILSIFQAPTKISFATPMVASLYPITRMFMTHAAQLRQSQPPMILLSVPGRNGVRTSAFLAWKKRLCTTTTTLLQIVPARASMPSGWRRSDVKPKAKLKKVRWLKQSQNRLIFPAQKSHTASTTLWTAPAPQRRWRTTSAAVWVAVCKGPVSRFCWKEFALQRQAQWQQPQQWPCHAWPMPGCSATWQFLRCTNVSLRDNWNEQRGAQWQNSWEYQVGIKHDLPFDPLREL